MTVREPGEGDEPCSGPLRRSKRRATLRGAAASLTAEIREGE
ncbi:hypothetical protein OEIGOIKO_01164 [Streptomyces chrestomyceticus JCM 4735]|uniref:Uncharacterized protein n=1 Tax=Streptomyces chrestomyceticus JCM 4735 TaxID=1306181 RepID=A0A7U9PYP4_9ACTN|nr:hypothetical protein OEIGOIKO_01164 [Streptomyces chrestomyceticus JCM 4735]